MGGLFPPICTSTAAHSSKVVLGSWAGQKPTLPTFRKSQKVDYVGFSLLWNGSFISASRVLVYDGVNKATILNSEISCISSFLIPRSGTRDFSWFFKSPLKDGLLQEKANAIKCRNGNIL